MSSLTDILRHPATAAALALAVLGCADFPNTFDRIDADMVRVLDFVYEPAEAAPGDTVDIYAIFAGKPVGAADLGWRMARDVAVNRVRVETPRDIVDMDSLWVTPPEEYPFSANTYGVHASFRIPRDLMEKSSMLRDNWSSLLPATEELDMPAELRPLLSLEVLLPIVDSMAQRAPEWQRALDEGGSPAADSLAVADRYYGIYSAIPSGALSLVLQSLTVRTRLFVSVKGAYTIESDYSVRYNSGIARLTGSGVRVNGNPRIDSMGIYRVARANLIDFDPEKSRYPFDWYPLFYREGNILTDTMVPIDKGYSYFAAGYVDPESTDSMTTLDGRDTLEDLRTLWFFQLDEDEVRDLSPSRYLNIVNIGSLIEPVFPATDSRVRSATIWLQVYDDALNVLFRPRGSSLVEGTLRFSYTEEYLEAAR